MAGTQADDGKDGGSEGDDFKDTPEEQARRWHMELEAAKKTLKKFHKRGDDVDKRFRDERDNKSDSATRLNLFTADTQSKRAMLYGKTPQVDVGRRFADANDDDARVGGELLERLLNSEIESDSDTYADALEHALDDRLLPGLGNVRVRYEAEFEDTDETPAITKTDEQGNSVELAPLVPSISQKKTENVCVDYVPWKDQLWSPARVESEVTWRAFRVFMKRGELVKRFGPLGKLVPLSAKRNKTEDGGFDPSQRGELWEIWDKETKRVYWLAKGFDKILDVQDDPLQLEGFFPCPKPMAANLTTSSTIPQPDYYLAQDPYNEIDLLSTRITLLERAVRVAGVYDASSDEIKQLLSEAGFNQLIPVQNWGGFSEKSGIAGSVDWLPLEQIANALTMLRQARVEAIDLVQQVTGHTDLMRGEATQAGASATEQAIKARFGSVRMQALQDDFARFASDVQKLKAEIIAKHFEPQTILERSNAQFMFDAATATRAVELIKSKFSCYRIEVKPEVVSLTDYAALKSERLEFLGGLTQFFQSMAPIGQQFPQALPMLLQIGQWVVAGQKGASQIEGVFDQMIAAAKQAAADAAAQPQQAPPDPKVQSEQIKLQGVQLKAQADMQREQFKAQAALQQGQAEVQNDAMREENQRASNVQEAAQKAMISQTLKPAKEVTPRGFP